MRPFFYAQLDQHTRELRYVNAGHNAPYLLRAGGDSEVEELTTGGTIIRHVPQTRYEEGRSRCTPATVADRFHRRRHRSAESGETKSSAKTA